MKNRRWQQAMFMIGMFASFTVIVICSVLMYQTFFRDTSTDIDDPKDPNKIIREEILKEAKVLVSKHYVDDALTLITQRPEIRNKDVDAYVAQLKIVQSSYVRYQGRIEHIFFHSLIVDPQKAYGPTSSDPKGYDLWMITVDEFKKILDQLYSRGYVLVSLEDIYEHVDGRWEEKPLFLPYGKKPLLVSVDNIGYTTSRIKDGFASKLILNEEMELISEITHSDQSKTLSKEGDVFPILETLLKQHPDFSYQDARAMLGVTGNMGILGYDPKKPEEKEEAIRLVNHMKILGWEFVNHSYTHAAGNYYSETSRLSSIQEDFELFHETMNPIMGKSNVFIAPFGILLKEPMFSYIQQQGYNVYATVDRRSQPVIQQGSLILPRVNIDGFVMRNDTEYINEHFFNVSEVFDSLRNP